MAKIVKKREKVLLFYNPYSGNGLFKNNLDLIIDRFQSNGFQVVPVRAAKGRVIETVMDEMEPNAYRQIVVAGGDGTINTCVNAMIKRDIDLPLAIFPSGTANDFAYYFELPDDIESMVDIAMGDIISYADLGKVNDKYFVNVAAMGTLVDVSQKTDPNMKNTLGVLSYYLRGLVELPNLHPIPVKITTEKKVYEENMYFLLVMNGESAGGFKKIAPGSDMADGKLNVVLFKEMPIRELPPLLISVIQGNHPRHKNVLSFSAKEITIESTEEVSTDVDGERGEKLPLHFSVLPKRLRIFTEREI